MEFHAILYPHAFKVSSKDLFGLQLQNSKTLRLIYFLELKVFLIELGSILKNIRVMVLSLCHNFI